MTAHLLATTVGPVQEFITAARRTRDLWFGSNLLSEISKAVAKIVHDQGGNLIFPAPRSAADLEPDSELNIANVILAELDGGDPKTLAGAARQAAQTRWRQYADQVFNEYRSVIRQDIWNDQVQDVIEFYAAWVLLGDNYKAARAQVMRLLAGRKNCRDFLPAKGRAGVPKSSLDGLRESVLRELPWPPRSQRRLRVREGEQLDVVGLVKRTAEGTRPYPSVARVAADPWIRGVGARNLAGLVAACEHLGGDVIHGLDTSSERGHPHFLQFPFEGTAVFRSRYSELREEKELSEDDLRPLSEALQALLRLWGEPNPYLAVLVADGDRMGQALSQLNRADEHRQFSQQLSRFAGEARQIVHEHQGVVVYSGGDDVLAFLPVDNCLSCARALHEKFGDLMKDWTTEEGEKLTLSVGLAIAHFMADLEELLYYGRAAEKHAKTPRVEDHGQMARNALAVHLLKRGGGPIEVRANWTTQPDEHLQTLAEWINDRAISGRIAYDLRKIADVYETWSSESVKDAIKRDTLSVMKGKQPGGESKMKEVEQLIRERVVDAASLRRLADELLIARQIAAAVRQASGQITRQEVSV